jgi:hypothetical protein
MNHELTIMRFAVLVLVLVLVATMFSGCATVAPDKTQQAEDLLYLAAEDRVSCELLDTYLGPAGSVFLVGSRENTLNLPFNQLAALGANGVYVVEDGSTGSGVIVEGYLCPVSETVVQPDPSAETELVEEDQSSTEEIDIKLKTVAEPVVPATDNSIVAAPALSAATPEKVVSQPDPSVETKSEEGDQPDTKSIEIKIVSDLDSAVPAVGTSVVAAPALSAATPEKLVPQPDPSVGTKFEEGDQPDAKGTEIKIASDPDSAVPAVATSVAVASEKATSLAEFERLLASGQQGNAEAQYQLGQAYQRGDHVDASRNLAVLWFASAANQGHKEARLRISPDCPLKDLGAGLEPGAPIGDCLVPNVDPSKEVAPGIDFSDSELLTNLVGNYEGTAREIFGSESKFKLKFYLVSSEKVAGRLEDVSGYHEELSDIVRIDPETWAVYGLPEGDCAIEKICIRMKWVSLVSTHTGFTWLQFEPDFSRYEGIVMHGGRAALEVSGSRVSLN